MDMSRITLRYIAVEAAKGILKRRQIARILKRRGFRHVGRGSWLGYCGRHIVSGLAINGPPLDVFLSSFTLPTFDAHNFIALSLGDYRLVDFANGKDVPGQCEAAIERYRATLWPIRSPGDLIHYIERSGNPGFYAIWATYLCHLRNGDLDRANATIGEDELEMFPETAIEKYREIAVPAFNGDREGVNKVFRRWETMSEQLFGRFDREFDAFGDGR